MRAASCRSRRHGLLHTPVKSFSVQKKNGLPGATACAAARTDSASAATGRMAGFRSEQKIAAHPQRMRQNHRLGEGRLTIA